MDYKSVAGSLVTLCLACLLVYYLGSNCWPRLCPALPKQGGPPRYQTDLIDMEVRAQLFHYFHCGQHHPPTTRLRRLLTIPTYTAKLWWQGLIVPVGRGPVQRPAPALPPPYSAPAVETPGFTPQYSYTNRYNKILCLFFTFTLHTIQVNIKPNQGRIGSYHSLSTVRERISKSLQEESFCEKSFSVPSGWECTQIKLLYRTLSVAELWLSLLSLHLLHNPAPPPLMFINT